MQMQFSPVCIVRFCKTCIDVIIDSMYITGLISTTHSETLAHRHAILRDVIPFSYMYLILSDRLT